MGLSEIIIILLVYSGLFLYASQAVYSNNKLTIYVKSVLLIILYCFISSTIWFTYKAEEYHINNHSGYEPVSFTGEALLMIGGFSIFTVFLLLLSFLLQRNRHSKSSRINDN